MEIKETIGRCARSNLDLPSGFGKIVSAKAENYARVADAGELRYFTERPMMLNIWTQTYAEDFQYLNAQQSQAQQLTVKDENPTQSETERFLMEKIRILEDSLRVHAELLEEIHTTSARKTEQLYSALPQQQQVQNQTKQIPQYAAYHANYKPQENVLTTTRESPTSSQMDAIHVPTSTPAVINAISHVPPKTESIKYTIIAEGNSDETGEPIEIQLTAPSDENSQLNSSADSGRLEICLTDDSMPSVNKEHHRNENNCVLPPKRRRYEVDHKILKLHTSDDEHCAYDATKQRKEQLQSPNNNSAKDYTLKTPNQNVKNQMEMHINMITLGPNNTRIPASVYENMNWKSPSIATRKLLMAVFDRQTLATHSMTGKPSPAFKDNSKPMKQMLDPHVIRDIIFAVTQKCNVSEKQVRNAITTKCADENKMMKLQLNKQRCTLQELNKENCA